MKSKEGLSGLRGKVMLSGTLAMFAMGSLQSEAFPADSDGYKPLNPESGDASAGEQEARASKIVHNFNVAPGTLQEVVAAFQQATGLKISVPDRYASLNSPGVKGVLTTAEAFTAALAGTQMSADFISPEKVILNLHAASQDVTVTAKSELDSLKYTAPLRDLPQTLTVIPESVMQNTGSVSLVEALRTVPGITFGAGEGGNPIGDRPFLRGVDSQSSTFVDGIRDIGSQTREIFDLESVEVSKGPSGTFAGRGASGGSINLNSKMARRENFLAGSFSPGTANFFRSTVDGNAKFTRWAAGRLNGMWQNSNIAGRDIANNSRYGFAPSLQFNVSHRVHMDLNYYDIRSHDIPDVGIPYNNPTFFARVDNRPRIFQTGDGQPLLLNRDSYYGFRSRDFRNEKVKTAFGRADVNISENVVLRNSYRYGKSGQDYIYSQPDDSQGNIYYGLVYRRALQRVANVDTSVNQSDLSGHFKTGSLEHTFAAGVEFARERSWNAAYLVGNPNYTAGTAPVPTFTVTSAATGKPVTGLSASRCPMGAGAAGGYYCTDLFNPTPDDPWLGVATRNDVTNPNSFVTNGEIKTNTPTRQATITRSLYGFDTVRVWKLQGTGGIRYDHYDSAYRTALTTVPVVTYPYSNGLVNYQGALAYKPKNEGTIYVAVSKSSTPPGNSLSQGQDPSALTTPINQALPPETTRSEEAGVKWDLFGSKALATAAVFQANTENVRITLADSSIAAGGERRNRGVDLGFSGNIIRRLQMFGGYTFMNAILVNAGGAGTAAGLMNGRRFPNTPENSFSVTSSYTVTRKLNLGGGVYGVGKVFGNDSPTAPKWVPNYVRVDAYGSYRFNAHMELQANLQNLTDKTYFLQAYTTHYASLAPGRQGRLTLNARF